MMTESIQSTKYLVNGSCGYMHSLSFAGDPPSEFTNAMATGRFSITVLDEPPRCINFRLTLPDGVDGAGIESLVGDAVVAPASDARMRVHCCTARRTMESGTQTYRCARVHAHAHDTHMQTRTHTLTHGHTHTHTHTIHIHTYTDT